MHPQTGIALIGPEPATLIGEVPHECLLAVGAAQLRDWWALPFEPRYADLMDFTAWRIWRLATDLAPSPTAPLARRSGRHVSLAEEGVRSLSPPHAGLPRIAIQGPGGCRLSLWYTMPSAAPRGALSPESRPDRSGSDIDAFGTV